MRVAAKIAIIAGMCSAAFGMLGVFTEWGWQQFAGAAGMVPGYALSTGLVLLFGGGILKMLVILGTCGIYIAVLIKATKNYLRRRNPEGHSAADPDGPES